MRHPHVVLCAFDDWLAAQLREMVAERRWVLKEFRQPAAWLDAASHRQPCVAILQADFTDAAANPLGLVADLHARNADAAVVVVSDVKLNDDDRPPWAAAAADVGARLVLFPPLTRPVLEDAVSGLMGVAAGDTAPRPESAIDLAAGEFEDGE